MAVVYSDEWLYVNEGGWERLVWEFENVINDINDLK
jgi:hypothetical protein